MRLRLLLALASLSAPAGAEPPDITQFDTVSGHAAIDPSARPLDLKTRRDPYDRMTVPVRIDGSGPYRFTVDTGADRTAISRELAGALKLPSGVGVRLHSVSGLVEVPTVTIGQLALAEEPVRIVDAPLLSSTDMGADGLLGIDSLRAQSILFDFKANRMSITPSRQRVDMGSSDVIVVRARERNGRLILTRASADRVPVTVVIDTGSQISIANSALRDLLLSRHRLQDLGPIELISVTGGVLQSRAARIDELSLGDVGLHDLHVAVADAHTFAQLDLDGKPAILLGMNAMRSFDRLAIDFATRKLRFVLPRDGDLGNPGVALRY